MIRYLYCKTFNKAYVSNGMGSGMLDGGIDGLAIFIPFVIFMLLRG